MIYTLFKYLSRHQFKAHPVKQKILKGGISGVKRVESKAPTVPEEFHLSHASRAHHDKETQEEHYEFHARPLNKKILEGPVVSVAVQEVEPPFFISSFLNQQYE